LYNQNMTRVAVTGLGCITPIGNTVAEFREAMYAGRSGIAPFDRSVRNFPGMTGDDPGLRFKATALVKNFDPANNPAQKLTTGIAASTDTSAQFGIVSARQAVEENSVLRHYDPSTMAVIIGCGCGGRAADEEANLGLYTRNARVSPLGIVRAMSSSGASNIAIETGVTGPVLNISTACASGTHAIGLAFQMVRSGQVSAAIAGGYEAALTFGFLRAWDSMRVVSPTACRPFAADRDGMTLGEGAAMLVLEPLDAALARGAHIYAEVVGFGMSADAHHITQPRAEGAALAIGRAIDDATATMGANREEIVQRIGYINAHGTGTPTNDAVEAQAIHQALGPLAAHVPVGATKGLTGHSIGAAGAIEALATTLALDAASLPHTANIGAVDPALNLDVIVDAPRPLEPGKDIALSNSLAFGGLNAVLAFKRHRHSGTT
jgi:nodulation protein E